MEPAIESLFATARRLEYKKGEIVLRPEEKPSGVYVLETGYLKVYSITNNGEESQHIVRKPGEVFPITWSLTDKRRDLYYQAITDSTLLRLPRDEFVEAFDKNPDVSHAIMNQFIRMMSTLYDRINNLQLRTATEKVAYRIMALDRRFGEEHEDGRRMILAPVRHHDVADSLTMSRETVSREMANLIKIGAIEYAGQNIIINDMSYLQSIVEGSAQHSSLKTAKEK